MQLHILIPGILWLHGAAVIDGIKDTQHGIPAVRHFLGNLDLSICFVSVVFIRQCAFAINVPVDNQVVMDCLSKLAVHNLFVALCIHKHFAFEEICGDSHRATGDCIRKLGLQALGKAVVALAGNDRQHIDRMDIISQYIGIHALADLIDAQTQAASHLLTLADLAAALFQSTDLKHIRVIPALAQRRVGEDEPHWRPFWVSVQQ